jgi:uncharacterized protein YbbC (DUF1343 family)
LRIIKLVDFLLAQKYPQNICTRTWFRGTADAGEHIVDGMDSTTGLPIISLYGSNKKPGQLKGIDIMVLIYKM